MKTSQWHRIHRIIAPTIVGMFAFPVAASGQLPRLVLNEVYVDFSTGVDAPLLKTKFNVYDPVGPTMEQFDQNVGIMDELNIDTYRIELAWGRGRSGFNLNTMITGTPDDLVYDFEPLDHMVTELDKRNVRLLGAYGYNPLPLQDPTLQRYASSSAPIDMEKWGEIVHTVAQHYVDLGITFGIDEVWNEADGLYSFYSGTEEEFHEIYRQWVHGVRSANPDATVAGPASAPELVWHRAFPEFIASENLPLDAFTFHHYGSGELGLNSVDKVAASLDRFAHFETTAMILDEWHSADLIEPWCRDDDVRDTYEGAQQILHDFDVFLSRPELTSVSWAWYMDPARAQETCMGLITNDGHRKAVFNAWKIYGNMPVDRKQVRSVGPLKAIASADDHNLGVVIWNPDPYRRRIDVHLENIPFDRGDVRVYRIDAENASYGDGAYEELTPVEAFEDVELGDFSWLDHIIPEHGTLYVEADDGSGLSDLTPVDVASVVKVNRYYPDRGTSSYADFDRKTWIARLGMADEQSANQQVGVLAGGLPGALRAEVEIEGQLGSPSANSLLGVRVDYRVGRTYTNGLLFHGPYDGVDVYSAERDMALPWEGRAADGDVNVITVSDLADFQIPLAEHAPDGWDGEAHIAFIMQDAGPGTRARIKLRPLE